jgi:hypothetical protein
LAKEKVKVSQSDLIAFEALDNGILSCTDPARLQQICDGLSADKIDGLLRKWLRLLPHPFIGADRAASYRYDISILQAEFSLTQVLDRPVHGRLFFEQVIRENLDLGRPEEVRLIFNRKVGSSSTYNRPLRPASAGISAVANPLKRAFANVDAQLTKWIKHAQLAA